MECPSIREQASGKREKKEKKYKKKKDKDPDDGDDPSSSSTSESSSSESSRRRKKKKKNRAKVADTVHIPSLPKAGEFRAWKNLVYLNINSASGREDDYALDWAQQLEDPKLTDDDAK